MREHLMRGAEREALVTADLLHRGFEVFTAVGNFSCDIIAQKSGRVLRFEVKGPRHGKLRRNATPHGPVGRTSNLSSKGSDCRLFDIHATILDDGTIIYQRSIFHTINAASAELPLREEINSRTTKKNLRRAQQMEN